MMSTLPRCVLSKMTMPFEGEYSALPEQTEVAMSAPTTTETQVDEEERSMTDLERVVDCYSALVSSGLNGWPDARRALNMQAVNATRFREELQGLERDGFISLIYTGDVLTGIVVLTSG